MGTLLQYNAKLSLLLHWCNNVVKKLAWGGGSETWVWGTSSTCTEPAGGEEMGRRRQAEGSDGSSKMDDGWGEGGSGQTSVAGAIEFCWGLLTNRTGITSPYKHYHGYMYMYTASMIIKKKQHKM